MVAHVVQTRRRALPHLLHILARSTKIIATLGPSCWSDEQMGMLIEQGVSIARINMSILHGGTVRLRGAGLAGSDAVNMLCWWLWSCAARQHAMQCSAMNEPGADPMGPPAEQPPPLRLPTQDQAKKLISAWKKAGEDRAAPGG